MSMNLPWKNLAPNIIRQRVMIEGTTKELVGPEQISSYLLALAEVTKMEVIGGPYTRSAHELGFAGWIHWRTSGCHFYSYSGSPALFTVDCYTCKPFSCEAAAEFTKNYFHTLELVWREIEV